MRILIVSRIDPEALETLRKSHDVAYEVNPPAADLPGLLRDREILVFRSGVEISRELLAGAPPLKHLIRAGSGTDNVDHEYATSKGITFQRIPEPAAWACSEMAFTLMLGLARKLLWADQTMRDGRWVKGEYDATLLYGKTLGIVGLGNIGSRVGELGVAFGMNVSGCVEHLTDERKREFAGRQIALTDLASVLRTSEFLSVHVPLSDTTRGLIGAEELSTVKKGAFLVNLSRGGIVDEPALLDVLKNGTMAGAGLDVHEVEKEGHTSRFASLDNVILTPHVGSQVRECQHRIGLRILELVSEYAKVATS